MESLNPLNKSALTKCSQHPFWVGLLLIYLNCWKGSLKSGVVQIHVLTTLTSTLNNLEDWGMTKRTRKIMISWLSAFTVSASSFNWYSPITEIQKENHPSQVMKIVNHVPLCYTAVHSITPYVANLGLINIRLII